MPLKNNRDKTMWVCLGVLNGLGIAVFILAMLFHISAYAGEKDDVSAPVEENSQEFLNPHWRDDSCAECHLGRPKKGEPLLLREDGDIIKLCNRCHEEVSAHAYIHATGMVPSKDKLDRMGPEFKEALYRGDSKGRLTCIVCHNLIYQCLKEERDRKSTNPLFFREGPYIGRTDMCYKCHEPARYVRMNPHDMISDEGEILTSRCVICHTGVPDVKSAKSINDVAFKVEKNLEQLCRRCHYDIPLHPGTFIAASQVGAGKKREPFSHMRVPSKKVIKRLETTTVEKGIIMPLEPGTGRIFCATCHNPHERGVQIRAEADRGADNAKRLRAGREGEICLMCHLI